VITRRLLRIGAFRMDLNRGNALGRVPLERNVSITSIIHDLSRAQ